MSLQLNQEIVDWGKWYLEHKDEGGDVFKKIAFQQKMIEGLLQMLLLAAKDIRTLEGVSPEITEKRLWLPKHMQNAR